MKLNKLWASVLALMALASCGRDLEPSVNMPTPKQPAAEYQLVRMDIKATQDDNALRVGYGVSDDEDGALTGLALAEKNVNLRIAVKQGVNGTPVVDTYSFTKVGRASFTFSDKIKIPVKNGDEPYYMAAVLVSEGTKENPDLEYATVDHAKSPTLVTFGEDKNNKPLLPNAENKIYPNIPYRSQWQQVEMKPEGIVANHTTIKLQPLGTLLRFRIHNMTKSSQDITQLLFNMPSFTNKGSIDFARTDEDNFPSWDLSHASIGIEYSLPAKLTLNPDEKSNWYYVWVKSYAYPKDIRPETVFVQYRKAEGQPYVETPIFKTKKLLRSGSVKVNFKIRDGVDAELDDLDETGDWETSDEIYDWPRSVLSRLSPGVMNKAENAFVTDENTRNTDVAYYTFDEALQKFKNPVPIMVQGKRRKYSLPTVGEMRSIFPAFSLVPESGLLLHFSVKELKVYKNVPERGITIGGVTQDYTSDFMQKPQQGGIYAIRFNGAGNKNRTAFRYYIEGNAATNAVLRVEACLLGNNPKYKDLTLEQVAEPSFWENTDTDKRTFPYYGSESGRITNPKLYEHNRRVAYWTSTRQTKTHVYFANLNYGAGSTSHTEQGDISDVRRDYPIFLFERK